MNYQTWLASVPPEITQDKLWLMEVYRVALFIGDLARLDIVPLPDSPVSHAPRTTHHV